MFEKISSQLDKKYPQSGSSEVNKVHVQGLKNISGEIVRSVYRISNTDLDASIELIKSQVKSFYPPQVVEQILNVQLKKLHKRNLNRDRVYLIFKDNSGFMTYFVLLKKRVQDDFIIGTYKYKVKFDIPQDMYIKNYTYSHSSQSFFSSSSTYICVDYTEMHSRGLTMQDIKILTMYAEIMEEEFDKIDLNSI